MLCLLILFYSLLRVQLYVLKNVHTGTSRAVQWLRLHASTAEGTGSITAQGTGTCHTVQPK